MHRRALVDLRTECEAIDAEYWTGLNGGGDSLSEHDLDDSAWAQSVHDYLAAGFERRHEEPDIGTELRTLECTGMTIVQALLDDIKIWAPHWALRNQVYKALWEDLQDRRPGHLYCWGDWMDRKPI